MKNKFIILIAVVAVLAIYPIYRYKSNAKVVAASLLDHSKALGKWSYGSISSDFSGNISIRNLSFTPEGFEGGFNIDSLKIETDSGYIFKNNSHELEYLLPERASLAFNTVVLNDKSSDLYERLKDNGMWLGLAGFGGSFGCRRETLEQFNDNDISQFFPKNQTFNMDMYYSRLENSSIDVDVIIDAEELFSSSWSSTIESSYVDERIIPDELLVKKLFYSYLDNGLNSKRNSVCGKNYNDSIAAYRLNASDHLQRFFRVNYAKELPQKLINWYQKTLLPEAEYNAIVEFPERRYMSEAFALPQKLFFSNISAQVSLNQNDYEDIVLQEIDFTNLDQEELMNEHLKKQRELKQIELSKQREEEEKRNPTVYKIGFSKQKLIPLKSLNSYVGKLLRFKTVSGRPIIGTLVSKNADTIVIRTSYKSGSAELNIASSKIISAELM